jgi:hypothetical protein
MGRTPILAPISYWQTSTRDDRRAKRRMPLGWAKMPVFDTSCRADRKALANLIQVKDSGVKETIDQQCAFALALPETNDCSLR